MDPLMFNIDNETVAKVIGAIIILSLFVERALALLFEWRVFLKITTNGVETGSKGIKEPMAFLASLGVVYAYGFDAMAVIFSEEKNSLVGYLLTAGVIAGGSKGSMKIFRDYFGWKSEAQKAVEAARSHAGDGAGK